ncbi:cytochrome P450 [Mollisia scopiformis]|uniref:Cytochrome P450 n=1 Tax=Mollisia scopiformis TaxID=149040 RepID=A0A132B5Z3_MOLSC|nr:cytochrome P450 [Mollisia scopiformis]KUJ07820.1 cytochrome P450 [Mollisia scopiformis]
MNGFVRQWGESAPSRSTPKGPPRIFDPIPFVFNTLQFVFNNDKFMNRATQALENSPVVKFWFAGKPVYLVAGLKNYQSIFASRDLTYNGIMLQIGFPRLWRMSDSEVKRFADDRSGIRETPLPGTEHIAPEQRYWAPKYHVLYEFLSRPHQLKPIVDQFTNQFSQVVEKYPVGEWTNLSIDKLTRGDFTRCAITTLFGPTIFELNPDFLDAFWDFDSYAGVLVYGLPEWMYPAPFRASDRFLDRIEKYVEAGLKNFNWDGSEVDVQWEPRFGSRVTRELAKWLTDAGFRRKTVAGGLGTLLFGQNSNTIPVVSWMLMELNKDPALLKAVREEVAGAFVTDSSTGERTLDVQKATSLPLLQSLWTEILRFRVSMVIMRTVEEPISIGGVNIAKGSLIHAYSRISQTDEETWGTSQHPADQFWAERHINFVEEKDWTGQLCKRREFALAASPAGFFPFGGGVPICPGRHFAKSEVFAMLAILVDRFEMEFVSWTNFDGSPSDRPAESNKRFSGIGSLPPDRDMIVRWKRIW